MIQIGASEAVEIARNWFRAGRSVTGDALVVHRLDGGPEYYHVTLEEGGRPVAVATVDAARGDVRESARIANGRSPLEVSAERAAKLSGLRKVTRVDLVWQPSRATRSPLYPVWRVSGEAVVYIDQQKHAWSELK